MTIDVELTDDPRRVLQVAEAFLASDPVRHNLVLTLLHSRLTSSLEGRHAVVRDDGAVVGVLFQSPLTYPATITPMAPELIAACVARLAAEDPRLPGVTGVAASAAGFAGGWAELAGVAVRPTQGQRIHEAGAVTAPRSVAGAVRAARRADLRLLAEWFTAFHADVGEPLFEDPSEMLAQRIGDHQVYVWDDRRPVSMAALTEPIAGAVRVQSVYTPPEHRNRGYAAACVASVSDAAQRDGRRCLLYTQLDNPVANSLYRRIGYRAVAEVLRYDFG